MAMTQDDSGAMTRRPKSAPRTAASAVVRKPNRLWRVAFGVALVLQLIAVYSPNVPAGPQINGLDKVIHVSIFAAPVLAGLMAGISAPWVLGILAVHAPVSELIQHFVLPHRSGEVFDVLADLAGVALGGLAYLVWSRRQH
jgi:VanZ family protein